MSDVNKPDPRGSIYKLASGLQKYCKDKEGVVPKQEELRLVLRALGRHWLEELAAGADKLYIPSLGTISIKPTRIVKVNDLENVGALKEVGGNRAKAVFSPSGKFKANADAVIQRRNSVGEQPVVIEDATGLSEDLMPTRTKEERTNTSMSLFDELGLPPEGVDIREVTD